MQIWYSIELIAILLAIGTFTTVLLIVNGVLSISRILIRRYVRRR